MLVNNPVLSGFYPDPSICRAGEDFYMVNSTFAYFPGVPIFHSKDMVHWEQIGNVLTRDSQLPLQGCGHSRGIFAPTIRFYDGVFYMITTNVSGGGNFIVKATDPKGPWSDPYYLGEDAPGIDPSLFFDTDGTCYYVGTRPNPEGVRYNGDWEIWVQELDLLTMSLTGQSHKVWKGAMNGVIWPEGPHLYKKDGLYYLMIAEGGTGPEHCVTVARSKDVFGPYVGNPCNPILTHRHLGQSYPIKYVGHGDLVETTDGQWFIVMLGARPCDGYTNMGRETFLANVIWENQWPVVNPGVGMLTEEVEVNLPESYLPPKSDFYNFLDKQLDPRFVVLRNPSQRCYSLEERPGYLRLYCQKETLKELANPSYVGVRQQHYYYMVTTHFEGDFNNGECAGLAIVQSNEYHIRFEYGCFEEQKILRVVTCINGEDIVKEKVLLETGSLNLKLICRGQKLNFYYSIADQEYTLLTADVDATILSTEVAGGFVGCTIGMYASGNGLDSENVADFSWFSYERISN